MDYISRLFEKDMIPGTAVLLRIYVQVVVVVESHEYRCLCVCVFVCVCSRLVTCVRARSKLHNSSIRKPSAYQIKIYTSYTTAV